MEKEKKLYDHNHDYYLVTLPYNIKLGVLEPNSLIYNSVIQYTDNAGKTNHFVKMTAINIFEQMGQGTINVLNPLYNEQNKNVKKYIDCPCTFHNGTMYKELAKNVWYNINCTIAVVKK